MGNYDPVTTYMVVSDDRRPYHFFRLSCDFLYLLYREHTNAEESHWKQKYC
jgi:hypothetical protein